jgi:hypothetical protein
MATKILTRAFFLEEAAVAAASLDKVINPSSSEAL